VAVTSDVSKDDAKITCERCRELLSCPACGWPIPISAAGAVNRGRRYHIACAAKLEVAH